MSSTLEDVFAPSFQQKPPVLLLLMLVMLMLTGLDGCDDAEDKLLF